MFRSTLIFYKKLFFCIFKSKLEGKLSTLYKELISLHGLMAEESNCPYQIWTSSHVTQAIRERLTTQTLKSCAIMKDCTDDLLELSLLFPSAPWVIA